jgi:hypothetical protein
MRGVGCSGGAEWPPIGEFLVILRQDYHSFIFSGNILAFNLCVLT